MPFSVPKTCEKQIWHYISSFFCHSGITPDQNNLREEKFVSAHSLEDVVYHTENMAAEAIESMAVVFAHGSVAVSCLWEAGSREI